MAYLVEFAARAARDLDALCEEKNAVESEAAAHWLSGLEKAINSLREHPSRCPATPESGRLRHLLYGTKPHVYRVIYCILEKQKVVQVLHIRHGARQKVRGKDKDKDKDKDKNK